MSDEVKVLSQSEAEEIKAKFDRESATRQFTGIYSHIMTGFLLAFAGFIYWATLIVAPIEQVRRTIFVGSLIFIGFMFYPIRKGMTGRINYVPWYDILLGIAGAGAFFYYAFNFREIALRGVMITNFDIAMGALGILLLGEICRRIIGLPLLVVAGGFITYAFLDQLSFPGMSFHSTLRRIVFELFYTTNGIIGVPIQVASTFIVVFIFLAAFLERSGIANFFIDLANSVAGAATGGPAKVAVIASALLALISGSSVANTVSSGPITIPTMKKNGYKPEFAAAVEASASTGGQIMPPIMGAAAFLMAEMTGIPYIVIAASAIIPAVLYFVGIFLAVHFEAKKLGLKGLSKETLPHFGKLMLAKGYLFLPIVILVFFMARGFSPAMAACYGILAVLIVTTIKKDTRFSPVRFIDAVAAGSRSTLGVGIACAVAGTVVAMVSLSGLGLRLVNVLVVIVNHPFFLNTGTSLIVALLLTMVACIIVGLGMPTTAKYAIMATITAPMVIRAGIEMDIMVPLLAAHMFVFFFGVVADITPPVALAAYAGAAIARCNPIKTAFIATRLAIVAFIIPFVFVLNPALLFIDAYLPIIIQAVISTSVGMIAIAAVLAGYLLGPLSVPLRVIGLVGGFLCISPNLVTDIAGVAIVGLMFAVQVIQRKRQRLAANV